MNIDLSDFLKANPDITLVDDNYDNYKLLLDHPDKISGFIANIEVGDKFIVEMYKDDFYQKIRLVVWDKDEDSSVCEESINFYDLDIKQRIINVLLYYKKYLNLMAFS